MHASYKFILYGGSGAFADRQRMLFDQLSIAEAECNREKNRDAYLAPMDVDSLTADKGRRPPRGGKKRACETRQFRGRESIFKRPEGPAPRNSSRSIPDHHKNPHKWMKYSLDDVRGDDMTDRSNAKTALAFLEELKARRAKEATDDKRDSDSPTENGNGEESPVISYGEGFQEPNRSAGVRFEKPKPAEATDGRNSVAIVKREEKPIFLRSKVLMPEYVVGRKQKAKKGKEKRGTLAVKVDRTKELKLNHLEEFDEEDERI